MSKEVIVGKSEVLAAELGRRCAAAAQRAVAAGRHFSIALPGGSLPAAFFPALAAAPIDWARVEVFFGDERVVPPDHADSNYRLAQEHLLREAKVQAAQVHRMAGDLGTLSQAAEAHEKLLLRRLGKPPRLDVAFLGVGPDGHVCSLFPGHALLQEEHRFVAAIDDSPKPPPRRLTLTLPTLREAYLVVVAALGESKAQVMAAALDDPASPLPVALALRGARQSLVLLDPAAASASSFAQAAQ